MLPRREPVQYTEGPNGVKVVVLDYEKLRDPEADFSDSIEEAFGYDGLGILTVRGVPNLSECRAALLPLGHKFANLPEEIKRKTEHKESLYSFGWSHGKERFDGAPDYSKGSYYNNPLYDRPFEDEELIKKYPSFCHPNIWPEEDLPELRPAFLNIGRLIVDVGLLIARQCDRFVKSKCETYEDGKLERIIRTSRAVKGRLLHYFPLDEAAAAASQQSNEQNYSSWCGWHNDHGSLTGLVSAMYMSKEGKEVQNPDPTSGLYIRSRHGELVKVGIPPDHLAFQIGETACVHSGGFLQATPHCVRGAAGPHSVGVSRETMAVFMEPQWDEPMSIPPGTNKESVTRGSAAQHLPPGVPPLSSRWDESYDFGKFTEETLRAYY
jgi:isopenicillin N synthase-like dioxygenase